MKKSLSHHIHLNKYIIITSIILIGLYVILGNVPDIMKNPIVPGAVVAVNMIVIVLAGIILGKDVGMVIGFLATAINATITGSSFEYAAIIPHTIMGYFAGLVRMKTNITLASFTIIIGHLLNLLAYILVGILAITEIQTRNFWLGIAYETIFGIFSIIILAYLYEGVCKKCGVKGIGKK